MQQYRILHLASCDQRARAVDGTIMVAGERFSAPNGYPALPWGMGPPSFITPNSPRWLVIDADDYDCVEGGARVRSGRILFDGSAQDASVALAEMSDEYRPRVAESVNVCEWNVGAVGLMGRLKSARYGTAAVGRYCKAELEDGAVAAAGHKSRVTGADGLTVAAASTAVVDVGSDAVVAVGDVGAARAGDRSVVASAGAARICVGMRGVAVGSFGSAFRGREGALFVARHLSPEGEQTAITGVVGPGGLEPDTWYRVVAGSFQVAGNDDIQANKGATK